MKVSSINYVYNTSFLQKSVKNKDETDKTKNIAIAAVGISTVVFAGVLLYKNCMPKSIKIDELRVGNDTTFYNKIIEGLKEYGIDVKAKALESIVSPEEFSALIKKFKPEHFQVGKQISEAKAINMSLDEFYKNAVNGDFRISLHTHSNFSDGKATPEQFLECARKYADKVAKLNKNDELPPFTIALTDHDNVDGCIEIIKIIAKNPEKYKNLKFVCGCEFSVKNGNMHHDITGLALNPFDKNLRKMLVDLKTERIKVVQDFLNKQPDFNGKKVSYEDLVEFEKQYYTKKGKPGKRSLENGSGIVCVRHGIKFYYKYINQPVDKESLNSLGDKKILPIETVLDAIKKNNGFASLTHPVKSFWRYIGDEELNKLKDMGINGIEVNHQYTPSKITQLGKNNHNIQDADNMFNKITQKYYDYAIKNGLFLSGGTDSHETQIFSRQPKIDKNFLTDKILT